MLHDMHFGAYPAGLSMTRFSLRCCSLSTMTTHGIDYAIVGGLQGSPGLTGSFVIVDQLIPLSGPFEPLGFSKVHLEKSSI
jgi:hypothetical protein